MVRDRHLQCIADCLDGFVVDSDVFVVAMRDLHYAHAGAIEIQQLLLALLVYLSGQFSWTSTEIDDHFDSIPFV